MYATDLMQLLTTRRTYRRFAQKPVSEEAVRDIVEALRLASSARNAQPVRLILIDKPEDIRKAHSLVKWAGALPPELGVPKDDELPTLFVAVLQQGGQHQSTDAGLAIGNMTLAAWAHGVGSCIMQAIDRPALTLWLALPEGMFLHSMVAFGYPTHTSTLEPMEEGAPTAYWLDGDKNYHVPRLTADKLAKRL